MNLNVFLYIVSQFYLLLFSVTCFYSNTTFRHKGICQFSLKELDSDVLYQFDLSRLEAQRFVSVFGEGHFYTYLSVCELYVDDHVTYDNPCPAGGIICFYDFKSRSLNKYLNWKLNYNPSDVSYDSVSQILNVTFDESSGSKVTVQLVCSKKDESPIFLGEFGNRLIFKWLSTTACPIEDLELRNKCIIKSDDESYILDMRNLKSDTYYTVKDKEVVYQLNLCSTIGSNGACKGNNVTVCKITTNDNKSVPIAYETGHYVYLNEEGVKIIYKGKTKIEITVVCDEKTIWPKFSNIVNGTKTLNFWVKSSLSCVPHYNRCLIPKNNTQYDLTPLRYKADNYLVKSLRNVPIFILNVCGYLINKKLPQPCSGKRIFICKLGGGNESSSVVGKYNENGIIVTSPGRLELVYTGGSVCHNNTLWSTKIQLICSEDEINYLRYDKADNCVHMFVWFTQYACPLKISYGKKCAVEENSNDLVRYDFTTLKIHGEDWKVYNDYDSNYSFRLNICRSLNRPCNNDVSGAVCLRKGDVEVVIGRPSLKPISVNGEKYFSMIGDQCYSGGPVSRTLIYMRCNFSQFRFEPRLISMDISNCAFTFEWYMKEACAPQKQKSCKFHSYNLQALPRKWDNYVVYVNETSYFVLNVCHNIISRRNVLCDKSAVACLVNVKSYNLEYKSIMIGQVSNMAYNAYNHEKYLSFTYSAGDQCGSSYYRVIYNFECSPFIVDSLIELEKFENCTYTFKWKTASGCSISKKQSLENQSYIAPCYAIDSTGRRYDFSSLANHVWNVVGFETGSVYSFIICGEHKFENCTLNNGACVRDKDGKYKSGGQLLPQLVNVSNSGTIMISYIGGDSCFSNMAVPRETIIRMFCSYTSEIDVFVMEETKNCVTFIAFVSPYSCPQPVHCDDHGKNLGWFNNRIQTRFGDLILGLCESAYSTAGIAHCSSLNSVDCHAVNRSLQLAPLKHYGYQLSYNPTILGFQSSDFILLNQEEATIKFTEGNQCPGFNSSTTSADLILKCNPNEYLSVPEPVGASTDCHHVFEWSTRRMCKMRKNILVSDDGCYIEDSITRYKIDLETLSNNAVHDVYDNENNTYTLDLCNNCRGVCFAGNLCKKTPKGNFGFGEITYVSYIPEKNSTLLFYDQGQPCLLTSYYAEVWLICDPNTTEIILKQEMSCSVLIEWRSPNACYTKPPGVYLMLDTNTVNMTSFFIKCLAILCVIIMIILVVGPPLYSKLHSRTFQHYYDNLFRYRKSMSSTEQTDDMYMVQFSSDTDSTLRQKKAEVKNIDTVFEML